MAFSEKELEVQKEYLDTLNTLNCNSKPLIDVLTEVADENKEFARVIVKCIEDQLDRVSVDLKLPILYLIDSIIKNERDDPVYKQLFSRRLHLFFAKVYKEGKEDVRSRLLKLRITWNGILQPVTLAALDNEVRKVNPTWQSGPAVHVNPKFIPQGSTAVPFVINSMKNENVSKANLPEYTKKDILIKRQQELLALKRKSEELERMESQKSVKTDEKNDPFTTLINRILTDAKKLENVAENSNEIEKVRESAVNGKTSLLKKRDQLIKETGHCNHGTLNESILILDNLIAKLDQSLVEQKAVMEKNHSSGSRASSATPVSKPSVSKSSSVPRAWPSKISTTSPYMFPKSTSNGTTPATSQNPPAFRIAPVNSQLINAVARRPRDPRLLRKFEEQESKTTVGNAAAPVEVKVSSASTPIDSKNDKQNVLLADASKTKEFVSDTSSLTVPAVSTRQSKESDLKTIVQVDRRKDQKSEKGPSKSSKANHIESSTRDDSPVSKASGLPLPPSVTKKEDSSSNEAGSASIECIIPAAPSISGEKFSANFKKDQSATKKESKPTKIRVKVIQKGTKEKSKRIAAALLESALPETASPESSMQSTSKNSSKENAGEKIVMTREARNKKIDSLAEGLLTVDEKQRKRFLQDLSKTHIRVAQKLEKVVSKKLKTGGAKPAVAEVSTPPAPPISTVAAPIIIDELMDITDDKNDLILVSGPSDSEMQDKTTPATTAKPDQPKDVVDVTNEISDEVDLKCEAVPVPMDISEDSGEKTPQPVEKDGPSDVEKESEKFVTKSPSAPMNLSEQLEAVMNASSTDAIPAPATQDVDIRPLLPNGIGLKLNCPLPVVPDIIAPALPLSTDTVATSTAAPFNNPFGLSQAPTQDIDYRQLFAFPLPAIPPTTESVEEPAPADQESKSDVPPTAAPVAVDEPSADKVATKRRPDDEPSEGAKRRRTISGGSDSESQPATAAKSVSPEPPSTLPSTLPLPPMASALENILNVPSDSDEEVAEPDGDEKAGPRGRREQSSYSLTAVVNEDDHSSDAGMAMEPRPASKSPPTFPMLPNPSFCTPNFRMFLSATPEIPEASPDVLKMIRRDPVRSIHIDGISREIRHYGLTAVTFLSWDDPRQISFYNGARRIIIDNDIEITCYLNGPDVECKVYGEYHRFRLGAPTRELYVDGIGYECYFDGSPKRIRIGNVYRSVRLTGGPPRVHIGMKKRQDLVAGKIEVIIDEEHASPVYLDAKPQAIYVKGVPFIIMFIDSLKRVLINDVPFRTAFGGLPQSFKFKNKVFSFRFDMLPAGIVPGAVSIFQMIMTKLPSPPPLPPSLRYCDDLPSIYPPSVPNIPISSVPSIDIKPAIGSENAPGELKPPPMNSLLENVNIDELFQKLVASGIVPTPHHEAESKPTVDSKKHVEHNTVKFVDFSKPETLKQKQPALISKLYSGIQCGSCGLRFPQEQTVKYSQHLDWHFRLNRRGKDGARMIHSRKWYYNFSNWMQFQEMEDNSDRGTSWFESQAATEYTEKEEEEVPCVSAGENAQDAVCVLCQDKFDQFYNQDIEEWQLRNAIRVDGILYHPTCHQDHTAREDNHSDVEEIVDLEEPIALDDSTPVEEFSISLLDHENVEAKENSPVVAENLEDESNTDLNKIVTINDDSIVIKQEKPDAPKSTEQINEKEKSTNTNEKTAATRTSSEKDTESDDDSDLEEVQLIEQPIEEIIINDDINDLEPNLETLNVEDIIAVQKEVDSLPEETAAEVEPVEIADKIVDITSVPNVATIDGNIELGDSLQVVSTGTKIKLNIVKPTTHNEEKVLSPKSPANEVEPVSDTEMDDLPKELPKELTTINAQPLPPGEELVTAAEIKPRLRERKLTEYPPVTKGTETSGLCSIM